MLLVKKKMEDRKGKELEKNSQRPGSYTRKNVTVCFVLFSEMCISQELRHAIPELARTKASTVPV